MHHEKSAQLEPKARTLADRPPAESRPLSKPKVALPLVAAAALIGLLWFSFRERLPEPGVPLPVQHATGTSAH